MLFLSFFLSFLFDYYVTRFSCLVLRPIEQEQCLVEYTHVSKKWTRPPKKWNSKNVPFILVSINFFSSSCFHRSPGKARTELPHSYSQHQNAATHKYLPFHSMNRKNMTSSSSFIFPNKHSAAACTAELKTHQI